MKNRWIAALAAIFLLATGIASALELSDYSTTAASNNAAPPNGFPEGQTPASLNNGIREVLARIARHHADLDTTLLATAGTSTAYTIAATRTISAYEDGLTIRAQIHTASGSTPTLNVDAVGAKAIYFQDGTQVTTNDLPAGAIVVFVFDNGNDHWKVVTAVGAPGISASSTDTLTNKTIDAANNTLSLTTDSVDSITEIAAALKSGADGTLVTGTAGTSGNLVQWNGDGDAVDSGIAASSVDTRPLTPDTAVATTSGTAKDFTIPAGTNRVTIIFNLVTGSGTDNQLVQLGDSGGVETTGYTAASSTGTTNLTSTAGFVIRTPSAAALSGIMVLTKVSDDIWVSSHSVNFAGAGVLGGGSRTTLDSALTTVRITWTGSDTFVSGSVNVFTE